MMHNFLKTHVNHHVGPVVDTYFSYDVIFVYLYHAIEYSLLLGQVNLQTWPLTTLDIVVVIPITFRRSNAKNFWWYSTTNQYQDLSECLCIHIMPNIWCSIFDGRTCPYVWFLKWTCPVPKFIRLNPKLVNSLNQFLFWLLTLKFPDQSNHCHVIFRGVVLLHVYNES